MAKTELISIINNLTHTCRRYNAIFRRLTGNEIKNLLNCYIEINNDFKVIKKGGNKVITSLICNKL